MTRLKQNIKTLGPVSAKLVGELQRSGKTIFTIQDAIQIYGKNRYATGDLLSELVRRRVLARVGPGIYLILQAGQELAQLRNWPMIAHAISAPTAYFISYYSAMRLHGMSTHPVSDIFITVSVKRQSREIYGLWYHFIYSKRRHFWGDAKHWVTKQNQVQVSDLERTLLDGFDRPDLCGGFNEVVRGLWSRQKYVDWMKLMRYAQRFRTRAAPRRLGFVCEILGIATEDFRKQFWLQTKGSRSYVLLDANGLRKGNFLHRWGLRLNVDIEEIKESIWG